MGSTEEQRRLSVSELERKNEEIESFNYGCQSPLAGAIAKDSNFHRSDSGRSDGSEGYGRLPVANYN